MSSSELVTLAGQLAEVAKKHGLKRLRAGGVEVERWPEQPEPEETRTDPRAEAEKVARLQRIDDWGHAGVMPRRKAGA